VDLVSFYSLGGRDDGAFGAEVAELYRRFAESLVGNIKSQLLAARRRNAETYAGGVKRQTKSALENFYLQGIFLDLLRLFKISPAVISVTLRKP
jgi:hypothetical protein